MKNVFILLAIALLSLTACGRTKYEYFVGQPGAAGQNGADGQSCTISEVTPSATYPNGGAVVSCGPNSVVIKNGANGETGAAGADAVLEIIDPCGDAPGVYDEVLLRLSNGALLASFSENANGKNTRFSVLTEGSSYQTTDGSNCTFSISANGEVTY